MRLRREMRNKLCSRKEPAEHEEYNKERNKMLRGAVKGQCTAGRLTCRMALSGQHFASKMAAGCL